MQSLLFCILVSILSKLNGEEGIWNLDFETCWYDFRFMANKIQ